MWHLCDKRLGLDHDAGLGYLLCGACGKKYVSQSKYPFWSKKKQFGWRVIQESHIRKYLESEWDSNLDRTRDFVSEQNEEKAKRANLKAICDAVADSAPAKKAVTRKRGRQPSRSKTRKRVKKTAQQSTLR